MTLEILTADILGPTQHGFFTRRGGASSGIFKGLNCGTGSSDQSEIVAINRARVAEAVRVPNGSLIALYQAHTSDVVTVKAPFPGEKPKADGMVTNVPGLALSILTADCQPVLFADLRAGVVGAAHAGWRGTLNGVLEATVETMVDLGANRDSISAAIGPSISQHAYEVGQEFFNTFLNEDQNNARFFAPGSGDRMQFDLPSYGLHRLQCVGVGAAEWIHHCTYSDSDRFFSYRRSTHAGEADYGRLISVIRL